MPLHAEISGLSPADIARMVAGGELRAADVLDCFEQRVRSLNPRLNAFIGESCDDARAAAGKIDRDVAEGIPPGRLAGVPVAVKANICRRGQPTHCCSRILGDYRPPYDATVVERIRSAGGIPVGPTNMDEFAMGSSTEYSAFGPTVNPWGSRLIPGGSSGGAAAAVAAGLSPLALGSDTGGSVRQPAALCGVVGFKPTWGEVSRFGLVAFASSLDQVGPIGRTVRDARLLFDVIRGPDEHDATSFPASTACPRAVKSLDGIRLGLPLEFLGEGLEAGVRASVETALASLRDAGASIVDVSLPTLKYSVPTYHLVAQAEASSNLARFDGVRYGVRAPEYDDIRQLYERTRSAGFGPEVKRRILLGTYVLSAGYYDEFYVKASKVRRLMPREFESAFAGVDFIVGPTSPVTAFPIGAKAGNPLAMYLCDVYTLCANLAGLCAVSIPCGLAEGLPVGLQILGRPRDDNALLDVAGFAEEVLGVLPDPMAAAIS
ncbi:MAG: Asp-tRNA(Asn)/Glu-tRNA(Gln) amidotransferase subunit GatA [Candidatus Brocadiia bacterium]